MSYNVRVFLRRIRRDNPPSRLSGPRGGMLFDRNLTGRNRLFWVKIGHFKAQKQLKNSP
nr:MAG TPA: hypothetical protein [Caudoviricetes sp.]